MAYVYPPNPNLKDDGRKHSLYLGKYDPKNRAEIDNEGWDIAIGIFGAMIIWGFCMIALFGF